MKPILRMRILVIALAMLPVLLWGQRTISGVVTDAESGETLIGANILVVGTSSGTVTDIDGSYQVQLPKGFNVLSFSYTGYATQEIEVGAANVLDVTLSAGSVLDEVVVIGYGTVEREDATGSVQTVDSKTFNRGAITSPQELLAGKIAGVAITTDGTPGGGASIRIRGGSSLSASNDPLIVIDGVPISNENTGGQRNILSLVNPNDIETFTVLKDASATAIYGSRASNGVIIITTKKGSLGTDLKVNYNASVAFSDVVKELDVLSPDEFRDIVARERPNNTDLLGTANTNWQDEIFQTGVMHDHNMNVSGAIAGKLPYRASVGYTNQAGLLQTDKFERVTYGFNLTPGFFDNRLQINAGVKGMSNKNRFADRAAIANAVGYDPTQPVRVSENRFGGYHAWLQQVNGEPITIAPANPVALLEQKEDRAIVNRTILNLSADYRFGFLPELRANLNLAYDETSTSGTVIVPDNAAFQFNPNPNGFSGTNNSYENEDTNELLEFYLNYVKDFGNSKLDLMGGYSWQNFREERFNRTEDENGVKENLDAREFFLISLFGRVNYSLFDRILLTATIRRDGSSRFSENNRFGLFPAAAVAWKIIDSDQPAGILNSLKLRVGYGVTGQQQVGDFYPAQAAYLESLSTADYQIGDDFIPTLRAEGYNANLKWEETTTYNVAVDFGLFGDRLNGSLEVYQRTTEDLLNFIPIPAGTNLSNFIDANVGDLENRGVELQLNGVPWRSNRGEWSLGVNVTYNENEITRLTATEDPNFQGVLTGDAISGGVGNKVQINSVGFPARSFYVYEQVYDEAGNPVEGLYVDQNGDGVINDQDLYRLEDPAADVFMGISSNFNYGKFDFSFAGRANIGNYLYNNNQSSLTEFSRLFNPSGYLNNLSSDAFLLNFTNPNVLSDYFIQNASFFRMDHITAGYMFDNIWKGNNSHRTLRVYATVQNPFVVTNYDGLDPEVFTGIDNNVYPRARTVLFGVNLNL